MLAGEANIRRRQWSDSRMHKVSVALRRDAVIGETDRRLFGAFVEHVGRGVYGGIYEPDHPSADERGFRRDVLALVRELGPTLVRYPGGNFVSGYEWEDGVGPRERRPRRLDLAWLSTESNAFGTNEFVDWCRAAEVEPMLAVNLGTRGGDAARRLLEYCNHPGGTELSDLRIAHGWAAPHGVRLWCLGNEMDGPWQMETKSADEYGRVAAQAAKMMKLFDPTLELAVCGSSGRNMPSFGAWEKKVLAHTLEHVDHVSLHTYLNDFAGDIPAMLASVDLMDGFIEEVVAIADRACALAGAAKRITLSFDEWNVWYRTRGGPPAATRSWPVAPPILEEVYSMADALAFGGAGIALLNHADRVRVACLAQLVNAIAPIMTETGGPAWRQTIFHPFAQISRYGRGRVLRAAVDSPTYAAVYCDPIADVRPSFAMPAVPVLKLAAVESFAGDAVTLFALNRDLERPLSVTFALDGFGAISLAGALQLRHADLHASNTRDRPDAVAPAPLNEVACGAGRVEAMLAPASWNTILLQRRG
jgi:alpha-L-arabinofuranosidase